MRTCRFHYTVHFLINFCSVAPDVNDISKITLRQALEMSESLRILYLQVQYLKVQISNGSHEYDEIEVSFSPSRLSISHYLVSRAS
jgi:hypothetical protein